MKKMKNKNQKMDMNINKHKIKLINLVLQFRQIMKTI